MKRSNPAKDAREEGFYHIADLFELVAAIEKEHEERYRRLVAKIKSGLVFSRNGKTFWRGRSITDSPRETDSSVSFSALLYVYITNSEKP